MNYRRSSCVVVSICLLATACGSDDADDATAGTETQSEPDATAGTETQSEPDATAGTETQSEPDATAGTETQSEPDAADEESSAADIETVKINLPFPNSILWYPLLLGDELGFFAEESIDVELIPGSGDVPANILLQQDEVDIACVNPSPIFEALDAGIDIRVIYEYWQTSVFDVVVPEDSEIQALDDLAGRTVGVSSEVGGDLPRFRSWLETEGLTEDDLTTVVVGDAGPVLAQSFNSGRIDAHIGSISDFVAIEVNGVGVRGLLPDELKVTPSCVWATLQSEIDTNGDTIERFLRAWAKSTAAGFENRDVIEAIAQQEIPEEWENPDFARSFLDFGLELQRSVTGEMGGIRPEVWTLVQEQLGRDEIIDPSVFLVDRFIAPANEFSIDDANAVADEYRSENL